MTDIRKEGLFHMKQVIPAPKPVRVLRAKTAGYRLLYALYESKRSGGGCSYSVTVTITDGRNCETAAASDLTRSPEEAVRLFMLLFRGTVTPCALADVLEELL